MDKVKIQINSLEALERMIGGDGEIEMDIRQNIVEAFSKKHLKSIANQEFMYQISNAIKHEAALGFVEKINDGSWNPKYVLTDKARELVISQIQAYIQTEITTLVKQVIEKESILDTIKSTLDRQAKYIQEELTERTLESRMNELINKKLKETLGIK